MKLVYPFNGGRALERVGQGAERLALACAAVGLLSLGGAVSGYLDVLTHLLPIWGGAGVAAGGLAIVSAIAGGGGARRIGWPAAAIMTIAACAGVLAGPEALAARPAPLGDGAMARLRLVQLNVWKHNRDLDETADWVLAQHPDVIVVEEAFSQNLPLVRRLRKALPYRVTCTSPEPCSTTILTRRPPLEHGGLKSRASKAPLAGAWATYPAAAGSFSVVAVQLPWPVPPSAQTDRAKQLVAVARGLAAPDLIVLGDFNSTPWSFFLRRLDRELGLTRVTRGLPTWPARGFLLTPRSFAFMPIDQVYVGCNWRAVKVRRGARVGSDHYPVVVDLERPADGRRGGGACP